MEIQWIMVGFNIATLIFFFGFHFGQFRDMKADVKIIRQDVQNIASKVDDTGLKVAHIEGWIDRQRKEPK